jgi:hypothetical protein
MLHFFFPRLVKPLGAMPLACLTLLVPELFRPDPEDHEVLDLPVCPALGALLARGRFTRCPPQPLEAVLARLFGHAAGVSLGALRLRGESGLLDDAATAGWIAADPVHLSFQRERLFLVGGASLSIAPDEASALVDALNDYFAGSGAFHAASPERWYLRPAGAGQSALERIDAPPLSAVAGRSVERQLAEMINERETGRLLNEIQTFLYAHPVNRQRKKRELSPINSLWLWGGGTRPSPVAADFDGVWSEGDPLVLGLARTAGLPSHSLPGGLSGLLASATPAKRRLVVLEGLAGPVCDENGGACRRAAAALEAYWFAPAWRALAAGAIGRLILVAPTAHGLLTWDAGRAAPWRIWHRPRTLTETVRILAATNGAAA